MYKVTYILSVYMYAAYVQRHLPLEKSWAKAKHKTPITSQTESQGITSLPGLLTAVPKL